MKTLLRKYRFWVMCVLPLAVIGWYWWTDPNHGAETMARLQWLSWIMVIAWLVYLLRRAFHPEARSAEAYRAAMQSPTGAGLVFLGLAILTAALFLGLAGRAAAADLPPGAVRYLPTLASEQRGHWPEMPLPSALAAQVEQETCPSLKSTKCWNPHAELKTSREYGFGLGQLTITSRFDNFKEARKLDITLRDWQFEDRYDPARQLRTLVLMDRSLDLRLGKLVPDAHERLAMTLAGYNGGLGGVLSDRRLCASIEGCDPARWWGHVERYSLKNKTAATGYGKSFFEINREYPRNIIRVRRVRYAEYFGDPLP